MPEGVEVKISADLIKPLVVGKTITAAYSTSNSRYGDSKNCGNRLLGEDYNRFTDFGNDTKVLDVCTKGKFMWWEFTGRWYMFCTFGMTGQWSFEEGKHPCFVFEFSDGSKAVFNDPRHFGTIKFTMNPQALFDKLNELGWDPLTRSIQEYDAFVHSHIHASKKPIGDVLMDQSIFAGVGNYIRAEALYLAKVSPHRLCYTLVADEIDRIQQALVDVMKESYQHQGATILTYKDAYGAEGKYSTCFKVYGQKNDPLGNRIKKETMPGGRTIHWSPAVQM